jgi:hypothetical protein
MLFGEQGRVLGVRLWSILHATSQKDLFENYVPGNLGKVYLGNEQSCDIVGKGVVTLVGLS